MAQDDYSRYKIIHTLQVTELRAHHTCVVKVVLWNGVGKHPLDDGSSQLDVLQNKTLHGLLSKEPVYRQIPTIWFRWGMVSHDWRLQNQRCDEVHTKSPI